MTAAYQRASLAIQHSIVPAKVTKSYDELGRVKVRFPWMDEKQESDWIIITSPMTGKERGLFFMPEENDQVLVAYAHSHVERSYILGGLWSDANKPPAKDRVKRIIKSVSGHVITLDDTKDSETISIVDKSGKNKIVLDAKNNTVTIESGGDLTIQSKGNLSLKSDKDISIKGTNVTIEAQQKVTAKGGTEMALNGPSGVKINDGALEVV